MTTTPPLPPQALTDEIARSLERIGRDEILRARFVDLFRDAEDQLGEPGRAIRDEVTGPLIDALHADVGILRKILKSGIVFDFHYRSKIARDFVMSAEAEPDHVWEPQTTKLLMHLSKGAANIVIGGAYSGDQAILVAKQMAGSGGVCHCFEPNREQFEMLRRNARNNGLDNMRFNDSGLWRDAATTLRLVGEDSFAHPEIVAAGETAPDDFATTTIDAYAATHAGTHAGIGGFDRLNVIMLDIEGAEMAALEGAEAHLSQPAATAPHVIFEVHKTYVDWSNGLENADIVRYLAGLGYRVFSVRDFQSNVAMAGEPIELIAPETTYLEGPPHGFNMMAVKDETILESDMFRICANVSPKLLLHKDPALHHPTGWLDGTARAAADAS